MNLSYQVKQSLLYFNTDLKAKKLVFEAGKHIKCQRLSMLFPIGAYELSEYDVMELSSPIYKGMECGYKQGCGVLVVSDSYKGKTFEFKFEVRKVGWYYEVVRWCDKDVI